MLVEFERKKKVVAPMSMRLQAIRASGSTRAYRRTENAAKTTPARVAVVDDHDILCEGLKAVFQACNDFEVVGIAGDRVAAVELVGDTIPDLVLLDVHIPGSGVETARQISLRFPTVKILMLSANDDQYYVDSSFRAGASGYLLKGIEASELLDAARQVLAGECLLPASVAADLLRFKRRPTRDNSTTSRCDVTLTDREEEVLVCITQGLNNAEIGERVGVTEPTVKHFVSNILQKLHVRNRVEAAIVGCERLQMRVHNDL